VEKYYGAGQGTDYNMAHARCMLDTKGYTHTHSEYVLHIAFPQQQWLNEHASVLLYTYIACVALYYVCSTDFQELTDIPSQYKSKTLTKDQAAGF
jgi:hypothetical protein